MYDLTTVRRCRRVLNAGLVLAAAAVSTSASPALAQVASTPDSVIRRITQASERLEITTNTSRILTLDKKIPRVQVNNPELLAVTPLSATQVQVSAKKAGVTQVNLWDEDGVIHSVDVFIYGDVRELEHALKTQFPHSTIRLYRYSNSLVLAGFIDRPDFVEPIMQMASDYAPKVINRMEVGGVQQVLLQVKIYEVSRTKLRALGMDVDIVGNTIQAMTQIPNVLDGGATIGVSTSGEFNLFVEALQEDQIAKILAEPKIVAVSGRAAQFNSGGEVGYVSQPPQGGGGNITIGWKKFGTTVDVIPIVLGNGNIRLEVRPKVSSLDPTLGVVTPGTTIPGFRERFVDTAVEMRAGQTFALAGLIERRTETVNRGIPYLSDLPVLGVPFRKVKDEINEIELLIMVTPQLVDAMDAHEVPYCGPGMSTMTPNNSELYWHGTVEVPNQCSECGQFDCVPTHGSTPCCPEGIMGRSSNSGYNGYPTGGHPEGAYGVPTEATPLPTPSYEDYEPIMEEGAAPMPEHDELVMPPGPQVNRLSAPNSAYTAMRSPKYQRTPHQSYQPQSAPQPASQSSMQQAGGMIGPVGYEQR